MSSLFVDEGVPLLRGQNIHPYRLNLTNLKYISADTHRKWKKSALQPGDVAIVRVGYPGTACVIPRGIGELNAASLVIVRPNPQLLDSNFLCYVLNSPWGKAQIQGRLVGAAQQVFNTHTASELEIPIPPLHTQQRIASILSAYNDLIENNARRIAILEEMARRLYEEWFVHFRFPGHEQVRMVESELGLIPEGWSLRTLGDVASVNAHSVRTGSVLDEILYVDIASVTPGVIAEMQSYRFTDAPGRARRKVAHGDIIWSCVRPNRRSYALVLDPEPNLIVSTGFAVLSPADVPYSYLYFATTTDSFVSYLVNHATGAAYPAVSASTFETAPIICPANNIAEQFHDAVAPMLSLCDTLKHKNTNLRAQRDLLLPKLISGEIDVSAFPETEAVAA